MNESKQIFYHIFALQYTCKFAQSSEFSENLVYQNEDNLKLSNYMVVVSCGSNDKCNNLYQNFTSNPL